MKYFDFDVMKFENTETFKRKLANILDEEYAGYLDDEFCFDEWLSDVQTSLELYKDYIFVPRQHTKDGCEHKIHFCGHIYLMVGRDVASEWDVIWDDDYDVIDFNDIDEVIGFVDFDEPV